VAFRLNLCVFKNKQTNKQTNKIVNFKFGIEIKKKVKSNTEIRPLEPLNNGE